MICEPCLKAGRIFKSDVSLFGESSEDGYVEFWHFQCKGSTWCDCQHVREPSLNQKALEAAK